VIASELVMRLPRKAVFGNSALLLQCHFHGCERLSQHFFDCRAISFLTASGLLAHVMREVTFADYQEVVSSVSD
jgi:hypothetical protein